jgi:hypothetical protein
MVCLLQWVPVDRDTNMYISCPLTQCLGRIFFSGLDDENFDMSLQGIRPTNYWPVSKRAGWIIRFLDQYLV